MLHNLIKLIVMATCTLHSMLYLALYGFLRFEFKTVAIMVSKYPGRYGVLLRRAFYRRTLQKCGANLTVFYGAFIVYPEVEIGDNCTIEEDSIIRMCSIGDDVIIAARVSIMSGSQHHDVSDVSTVFWKSRSFAKRVFVGNNVWIGTHAVVMEDIASNTAVGAGAVVTRKYEQHWVIAGVPAKPIRNRMAK